MKPYESLPTELLTKIWKLALPTREEALEIGKRPLFHQGPWVLGRVCGRWRAIMLNTPDMWSHLFISIPTATAPWVNYPLALLEEQISRAGQRPLRVTFISEEYPGYTTAKIFACIAHSCARWDTLEIVTRWSLPPDALLRMHNNIPLLREINICVDIQTGFVQQNVFQFAPSLRVVRIRESRTRIMARGNLLDWNAHYEYGPPMSSLSSVFPWAQLTYYESQFTDPSHFDALCLAQNLVVCKAVIVEPNEATAGSVPSHLFRLISLQKLSLVFYGRGILLDRLVLPALQDFFIQVEPKEFQHVVALMERSQCSLRRFWIHPAPDPAHYRQMLLANPGIDELGIIGRYNVDDIIHGLRVDAADLLVPRLRSFCIQDKFEGLDMHAVLDMVCGRIGGGLERLCITKCGTRVFPHDLRARIPGLEKMGLQVKFRSDDEEIDF
ncbi:hypothetical protein FB451DRAFT_1552806 [Mycena latifolia]|nr:hypothetical protein FB451DRAFT_1552806 [Mycena latifolia]